MRGLEWAKTISIRVLDPMKNLFGLIGVVLIAAFLTSCSQEPPQPYTITGDLIVVENDESEDTGTEAASTDEPDARLDPSTVTVMVTYETTTKNGDVESVELATGDFSEGSFEFTGVVDEPTTVEIAVNVGEDEPLTASAVLSPGGITKFVVMDYLGSYPTDQLAMKGSSFLSKDSKKKFSISGDFSSVEEDLSHAVVSISALQYDDEGEYQGINLGTVKLENDSFTLQADIDEPSQVQVYLSAPGQGMSYYASTQDLVVEPGAEIIISNRGKAPMLFATSGVGMQAALIESWQQTDEYLTTFDKYSKAYTEYIAEWEAQLEAAQADTEESEVTDEEAVAEEEIEDNAQSDGETAEESSSAIASAEPAVQVAEGCEHVTVASEPTGSFQSADASDLPEYYKIQQQLYGFKGDALQEIATQSDDPFKALLAMELGAFGFGAENLSDALPIYDRLATMFDDDRLVQRVGKARDTMVWRIESEQNDEGLTPGQKAPEFTLANLEGTEVALYDVLAETELVLIDFWASWCGPCIADFPELKKLYSAYNDLGFEIVGVSIDSAFEDWEGGSIDNELPWIDLGEMDGWQGATATSYGVLAIPKGYLLDSKGCILDKNVRPAMLEEALVARFGEVPELTEPSQESESETEDLGSDEMGG